MNLQFHRVQFQANSKDCGVYTLAFVAISSRKYSHSKLLRKYLADCFESGQMRPVTKKLVQGKNRSGRTSFGCQNWSDPTKNGPAEIASQF